MELDLARFLKDHNVHNTHLLLLSRVSERNNNHGGSQHWILGEQDVLDTH
jgi:hypothetical protein